MRISDWSSDVCSSDLQSLHAGIGQQRLVDALQAVDLPVLVGDQGRPVEAGGRHRPAEAGGILEVLVEVGGVGQQLFRHAAADDAGAAVAVGLGDGQIGRANV